MHATSFMDNHLIPFTVTDNKTYLKVKIATFFSKYIFLTLKYSLIFVAQYWLSTWLRTNWKISGINYFFFFLCFGGNGCSCARLRFGHGIVSWRLKLNDFIPAINEDFNCWINLGEELNQFGTSIIRQSERTKVKSQKMNLQITKSKSSKRQKKLRKSRLCHLVWHMTFGDTVPYPPPPPPKSFTYYLNGPF